MSITSVKDIIAELKLGNLPLEFLEEHRVVDPAHPAAQAVNSYNQKIIDRLLRAQGIDPSSVSFRYLLVDKDEPNAFMISIANPPIVGVSKGLLKVLEYEDELAGIDRHELEHKNLSAYRNTKVQEWLADQSAPDTLQNAGYNPEGLTSGLRKLPTEKEKSIHKYGTKDIYEYMDEHPDLNIRIRDLENHTVIKARKEGHLNSGWTPIDGSVQAAAQTAMTAPRYIQRLLETSGFNEMSPVDKMWLLGQMFDHEFNELDSYFESRVEDFSAAISALEIDLNDPTQKRAFNDLLDRFLISPNLPPEYNEYHWASRAENFYQASYKIAGELSEKRAFTYKALKPIGRLQELDEAIQSFTTSTSAIEAERHATVINDLAARYDFITRPNIPADVILSNFPRPSEREIREVATGKRTEGVTVAWTPHVEWANQTASPQIRHALQRLGIGTDTRLSPQTSEEKRSIQAFQGEMRADLRFNDRGEIIGAGEEFERKMDFPAPGVTADQYLDYEIKRMTLRDQVETRLVSTVNWSELEKDFDHFVAKHRKYLTPESTVAHGGGDTFAREFVRRVEGLIESDPAVYKPLVRNFLTNHYTGVPNALINMLGNSKEDMGTFVSGMPKGMSPSHPYVNFVLADPDMMFKIEEKAKLVAYTAYRKNESITGTEEDQFSINPELVFRSYPAGFDGLLQFFNECKMRSDLNDNPYRRAILAFRLHAFLQQNNNVPLPPNQMQAIRSMVDDIKEIIAAETTELLNRQTEAQIESDLSPQRTAHEIAETYALYIAGDQFSMNTPLRRRYEAAIMERAVNITDRSERERLAQSLLYMREVPSILIHAKDCYYLSSNPFIKNQYTGELHSHDFRDWAADLYVNCLAEEFGIDDGSEAYCARVRDKLGDTHEQTSIREMGIGMGRKISGSVSNSVLSQVLPPLADVVNAQPRTAYFMRDLWNNRNLGGAIGLGYLGGGVELSIDILAENAPMRHSTIDFLTSPLNDEDALNYGKLLNEAVRHSSHSDKFGELGGHQTWSDATCLDTAEAIHQNFWRAPMEARGWYLDKILFPPGQHDEQAFKDAMHLVMSKTFPGLKPSIEYQATANQIENERRARDHRKRIDKQAYARLKLSDEIRMTIPDSEEERRLIRLSNKMERAFKIESFKHGASDILGRVSYGRWNRIFRQDDEETLTVRQIAESYVEVVPVPEQRLLLTAMIAARDISQQEYQNENSVRPGKFAAQVLTYMDEMGGKALQAINSHSDTPQHVKDDTGHAKSDYNKPKRWDALAWCQEYGIQASSPEEEIAHYGRVEASGSMGFTMFNRTADGNLYADTLLRPHAAGRCEREADNMIRASRRLAEKNPKLSAAVDIAEVAKRDAYVETCMSLAHKQGEVARQVYNGLETWAIVNGKEYHLIHETADVTQHSEGGKRARVIQGTEFKKLPEETQEQCEYKKAMAIQLYGTEILNRLEGMPCDRDRHGANQKINGETVGHFDFGMTELALPTERQKRAMIKAVVNAYWDHAIFHKDVSAALEKHIKKAHLPPEDMHYLQAFKRQMLALGDFEAYITEPEKKAILGSILACNKVDPVIRDEIRKDLGPLKNVLVNYLIGYAEKHTTFRFDDSRRASEIVMPVLTKEEQAIVNGEMTAKAVQAKPVICITDAPHHDGPMRQMARMSHATLKLLGIRAA